MRDNWSVALVGPKAVLVPYRREHVAKYHAWMQDEALLEATASEPLSLAEEYAMQRSWRDDPRKLTFIVLARTQSSGERSVEFSSDPASASALSEAPSSPGGESAMAGDTNLFFNDPEDPDCAEIEIMIAEPRYRRCGIATEALQTMMAFARRTLGVTRFVAKIGYDNAASLELFLSPRLGYRVFEKHDWCEETHLELVLADDSEMAKSAEANIELWAQRVALLRDSPSDDEEDSFTSSPGRGVFGAIWFWRRLALASSAPSLLSPFLPARDALALGLCGRAAYGMFRVREFKPFHNRNVKEKKEETDEGEDSLSSDDDEPVPNPHFTGLALFDRDSMWYLDLAGGEMRFPDVDGDGEQGTPLFVRDDPVGNCSKDDTGHITWDGALVLAKFLELRSNKSSSLHCLPILVDEGTTILELGAGTGFVGLACAVLGAKQVYLTDLPYALSIAKKNTEKNVLAGSISRPQVTVREFDWFVNYAEKTEGSSCDFAATTSLWSVEELCSVDLIVGADVIWQRELVAPLAKTLRWFLSLPCIGDRQRCAYLLYTSRYGEEFDAFVKEKFAAAALAIHVVPVNQLHSTYQYPTGFVWEITTTS
eukprot:g3413.t1